MAILRLLDETTVRAVTAAARASERRRANLDLHPSHAAPIQRMLNALQPSTYIRPHRHAAERFELLVAVRGCCGVLVFDDAGDVNEATVLSPDGVWGAEMPGGAWHTLVALAPDTLLLEVKPGPFDPHTDKEFAAWSPPEGSEAAARDLARWRVLAAAPRAGDANDA